VFQFDGIIHIHPPPPNRRELPFLVLAWWYLQHGFPQKAGIKEFFDSPVKIWQVLLGILVLGAGSLLVLRSGNVGSEYVSGYELNLRGLLGGLLGVRPRFKEFLIGYPALILLPFALDRKWLRFLPPNEANDEMFFVEEERHVRADNTFSFHALRFEAPRHLPDRTVQVRFQRKNPATRVVVYYKGERMGQARPLDAIANDRPPKKPKSDPGEAAGAAPVRPQSPSPVPAAGAATAATVNSQPSSLH